MENEEKGQKNMAVVSTNNTALGTGKSSDPDHQSLLTRAEFHILAQVPAEAEWFANIANPRTRRAYQIDIQEFMAFVGIARPEEFRQVSCAHILAWRKDLEARELSGATIRRKLAALSSLFEDLEGRKLAGATIRRKLADLSSLFEHLCEVNAITHNPVKGVKRPAVESQEGKTPALGDHEARKLLNAPDPTTLKGKRDRALLSVFLYHGLRREELCALQVKDLTQRRGVAHLRVHGKG